MLRSMSPSSLQKAYDDCYMSCSTAVYFEREGNEHEATQYWRRGLDQVNEYHATRNFNPNPRSETDKELLKSLRDLETQCKERLDLLEALRLSRAESESSSGNLGVWLCRSAQSPEKGFIGDGTIPAVSYPDLPRPFLAQRLPAQSRSSSERIAAGGSSRSSLEAPKSYKKPLPIPYNNPTPTRALRSTSPDKQQHVMRKTLRSGKPGDRGKLARRQSKPAAEGLGASKAATIAWSKETPSRRNPLDMSPNSTSLVVANGSPIEHSRRASGPANIQLDGYFRRLSTPREADANVIGQTLMTGDRLDTVASRRSLEECPAAGPSMASISAASSALNNRYCSEPQVSDPDLGRTSRRQASGTTGRVRQSRHHDLPPSPIFNTRDSPRDLHEKRSSSLDLPIRCKSIGNGSGSSGVVQAPCRPSPSQPLKSHKSNTRQKRDSSSSFDEITEESKSRKRKSHLKDKDRELEFLLGVESPARRSEEELSDEAEDKDVTEAKAWKKRKAQILRRSPCGVDKVAAKQILNEIVVKGDEVRWGDIAGLEVAKAALRETVVYPFLRPDLFMGLREPARGMLLFGPPGTGKTMLARAVATESASTFFSISASSLTSKYLGESEKLVRALFGLARLLAPSIIFVDEIDSLLSQRSGSGDHEATRRIKTEFLIQWSDLQRAAAGRDVNERDKERSDANQVLVLAATNLPWAIDEAARRRFVRRQYIPLPEEETRRTQLVTLLGQQKHDLSEEGIGELVTATDGFSGSDITALAKDAAMGPLRSLGEALLNMKTDDIRPISLEDFRASLKTIRPSVSTEGLEEYEAWARKYGERGG